VASHFANVPHPRALQIGKAGGKIHHEPNLLISKGVRVGGIRCLLNVER
jgi:hypothetical protein